LAATRNVNPSDLLLPLASKSAGWVEREFDADKLPSGADVGMARVARFILGWVDIRECVPFLINRDNVI